MVVWVVVLFVCVCGVVVVLSCSAGVSSEVRIKKARVFSLCLCGLPVCVVQLVAL